MSHAPVPDSIIDTVRGLYCDGQLPELGGNLSFQDPLVRIDTLRQSLRMFQTLRWLFPRSELTRFEPLATLPQSEERTTTWYRMEVCYRRSASGPGHPVLSHLAVTTEGGVVVQLVEDWKAPLQIRADSAPALHGIRSLLGRIFGLSLRSPP